MLNYRPTLSHRLKRGFAGRRWLHASSLAFAALIVCKGSVIGSSHWRTLERVTVGG